MKSPFALFIVLRLTGLLVSVSGLSVWQTPEIINTTQGGNVSISCDIEANATTERILVVWLKNNVNVSSETFNTTMNRLLNNGNVRITATLHLPLILPNDSGAYQCKVSQDMPTLETKDGKATHLYIGVNGLTVMTTSSQGNLSEDKLMIGSLSTLGIVFLLFSIAVVIYYKGLNRSRHHEAIATNETAIDSQHVVTPENVVYAAINVSIHQESMKSRIENCAALVPLTVTCNEDSVTYSEVHIKNKPKDEG